jgi:hypothetical protein
MHDKSESRSMPRCEFLIVGLASNCEDKLRGDIDALLRAVGNSHTLSWLIVESDSVDNTANVLKEIADEVPNFRVFNLGFLRKSLPLRTQRIAHCRNMYLTELQSNSLYAGVNYVIVADLDGVNGQLSRSGLSSCWERSAWEVCTANQRGPYYDIWALRHSLWSPGDCWKQYEFLVAHGVRKEKAREAALYSKMIIVDEQCEWIEVDSAFGGLAVYRREALNGVEYMGFDETGEAICEHVPLHRLIKANGGRIFINPRLINACETEHSKALHLAERIRRRYHDLWAHAKRKIFDWRASD